MHAPKHYIARPFWYPWAVLVANIFWFWTCIFRMIRAEKCRFDKMCLNFMHAPKHYIAQPFWYPWAVLVANIFWFWTCIFQMCSIKIFCLWSKKRWRRLPQKWSWWNYFGGNFKNSKISTEQEVQARGSQKQHQANVVRCVRCVSQTKVSVGDIYTSTPKMIDVVVVNTPPKNK